MIERIEPESGLDFERWLIQGALGGTVAGALFALFLMLVAAVTHGIGSVFLPLRMLGGIVLGAPALDPDYPLLGAASAGLLVHLALSASFGALFGVVAPALPVLAHDHGLAIAAGLYGLLLWLVNVYLLAPGFGWTWFPEQTSPVIQFVGHAVVYGATLGDFLERAFQARGL